jgi:hypothetical protein
MLLFYFTTPNFTFFSPCILSPPLSFFNPQWRTTLSVAAFSPATLTYLCVVYIWRPRSGVITSVSPHLTFTQDISDGSSRNLWYGSTGLMCLPRSYYLPWFFLWVFKLLWFSTLFLTCTHTHAHAHTHTSTFFYFCYCCSDSCTLCAVWICVAVIRESKSYVVP